MSHEVFFLPRLLGQTWADALDSASNAAQVQHAGIISERLQPWGRLVLRAAALLGPGSAFRARRHGEYRHTATGTRLVFHGEDGLLSIPSWLDDRAAIDLFGRIPAFARAVRDETGLEAFCPRRGCAVGELTVTELVADYRVRRMEIAELLGPASGADSIASAGRLAVPAPAPAAVPRPVPADTTAPASAPTSPEAVPAVPPRVSPRPAPLVGEWVVPPAPPAPVRPGALGPARTLPPPPTWQPLARVQVTSGPPGRGGGGRWRGLVGDAGAAPVQDVDQGLRARRRERARDGWGDHP